MRTDTAFVTLFALATAVALVARWIKIPYTVALVLAGLVLGNVHAVHAPHLTKELLYAVILPGLVFEAAFHLEFRRFWQNKLAIFALAIPGVAAAIALTAAMLTPVANALHFVTGFTLIHALVFAALIAATDPIAVIGLFKSLGAPKRLGVLVEGESLLNDGTAVVFFTIVLGIAGGQAISPSLAVVNFIRVVGMGALIGTLVGYAASKITQRIDDPMIEITLTTIAAYGSFIAAEQMHYSGVIATVVTGMLCGNYAASTGMSPSTRVAVESFWEYVAFALNSIVFLLIGFEVHAGALLASWKAILAAYTAVTLGRAVLIFAVSALLRRTRERIPWAWSAVLTWGGLRGGLSMVLVLGLPQNFPHRELLVTMTFGVVILSILAQGTTMAPLLRRLGIVTAHEEHLAYDAQRGAARAANAALAAIDAMDREGALHTELAASLRQQYQERLRAAEAAMQDLHTKQSALRQQELHAARRELLMVEKSAVLESYRKGTIGQHALESLLRDIDARLQRLESGEATDDHEAVTLQPPRPEHLEERPYATRPRGPTRESPCEPQGIPPSRQNVSDQ